MAEDWKTIRIPKGVYEDAKERKEQHGVTWGEYVNPHAWHSVFDEPYLPEDEPAAVECGKAELLEEIHAELDNLENKVSTSGVEDRDFDDWFTPDHAKTVAEHIRLELTESRKPVELEATEYRKIADEVAGRLR